MMISSAGRDCTLTLARALASASGLWYVGIITEIVVRITGASVEAEVASRSSAASN